MNDDYETYPPRHPDFIELPVRPLRPRNTGRLARLQPERVASQVGKTKKHKRGGFLRRWFGGRG